MSSTLKARQIAILGTVDSQQGREHARAAPRDWTSSYELCSPTHLYMPLIVELNVCTERSESSLLGMHVKKSGSNIF